MLFQIQMQTQTQIQKYIKSLRELFRNDSWKFWVLHYLSYVSIAAVWFWWARDSHLLPSRVQSPFLFLKNNMLCCQTYFKFSLISSLWANHSNLYQHFASFYIYEQISTIIISIRKSSIKRFEAKTPTYLEVVLLFQEGW